MVVNTLSIHLKQNHESFWTNYSHHSTKRRRWQSMFTYEEYAELNTCVVSQVTLIKRINDSLPLFCFLIQLCQFFNYVLCLRFINWQTKCTKKENIWNMLFLKEYLSKSKIVYFDILLSQFDLSQTENFCLYKIFTTCETKS